LSCLKAETVAINETDAWVLSADTVVGVGSRVLGKPEDVIQARKFLEFLSGRRHKVYSGITVIAPETPPVTRLVSTTVIFKRLEDGEINHYIESEEWQGKAGGYAIQGAAGAFIRTMNGSYFNVVGLPLYETLSLLRGTGYVAPR
jgi:septum formation protein